MLIACLYFGMDLQCCNHVHQKEDICKDISNSRSLNCVSSAVTDLHNFVFTLNTVPFHLLFQIPPVLLTTALSPRHI